MKKTFLYIPLAALLLTTSSCDKGFDELNVNPTAATTLNPVFTFNNAMVGTSFPGGILTFEEPTVQQMFTPNSGIVAGGNFNIDNRGPSGVNGAIWRQYYQNVVRYLVDVVNQTKSDANRANLYNMARIWKAYTFSVLTDTYGDIPYSQAGLGYISANVVPKYDTQESIYNDLIKELTEATTALDASKPTEAGEITYGGDVAKWKKFGNSLLLRVGMRLSKVNPTLAQSTVQKAVAGGLQQSNADNALVKNNANYTNGVGATLNSTEAANYYLTSTFVNYLKSTSDPRLASIAVRYVGAKSGPEQTAAKANRDPAVQIGMPMGYDNGTIADRAVIDIGTREFYGYSQLDRTRMGSQFAPCYLVTYAQTQLLLAEAAQRGWTTGNAADFYNAGVTAHMKQLGDYDATSLVSDANIAAYLQKNPYDAAKGYELINTQYWIASFLNGPEVFANFRRSGFPALTPNPYPGKEIKGNFIYRLSYPDSEQSVNTANRQEAVTRQGPDNLDTHVWWDKQ
ncbi:SusD/RagB family nutrient-binding outer membrane lipoprotein [Spirosoma sp. KCTC 42546]|uniref:SusD/RagB family nutrient-binding outer membrane lipoprotein n=1 Tax=Spirosoma sp. KCTC 42546 TaxID=2520506 RepID=UPI0011574EE9|nr:SusD/RagB family nutrient-binding outer membrane lipoprotein [Spirosoma sp. KCTC 42546]QDK82819.1 SusD/RagB family nutrient-binding outer membrane lipoprotein [Spirosoma sp. KCTC 42546]